MFFKGIFTSHVCFQITIPEITLGGERMIHFMSKNCTPSPNCLILQTLYNIPIETTCCRFFLVLFSSGIREDVFWFKAFFPQ